MASQFFGFQKTVSTSDLRRWISVWIFVSASNFGVRYDFGFGISNMPKWVLEDLLHWNVEMVSDSFRRTERTKILLGGFLKNRKEQKVRKYYGS
ncbi:unnamed protein product [Rhizophagus irregularis]|nr:unnamed protein product [Rhizophagus irregularis]